MILGITNIGNGELAVIGLGMVGLYLIGHLGRQLIDLWIGNMRHHGEPELLDEYADFNHELADNMTAVMDATREPAPAYPEADEDAASTGKHAVVPESVVETTRLTPVAGDLLPGTARFAVPMPGDPDPRDVLRERMAGEAR